MKTKSCIFIGLSILAALALAFLLREPRVDFSDNPALLLSVSQNGIATLETQNGLLELPLDALDSGKGTEMDEHARAAVRIAQQDKVAYRITARRTLQIWYETPHGPVLLNSALTGGREQ